MPLVCRPIWNAATVALRLRRRSRGIVLAQIFLGGVGLVIFLNHVLALPGHADDWSAFNGKSFAFVRAIDGESISVLNDSNQLPVTVRLLGAEKRNDVWDGRAKAALQMMLHGRRIALHLEPTQTRDPKGRLVAFAFIDDGRAVSAELARQGLVLADRKIPYAFHGAVEQAEHAARQKHLGLWKAN